MSDAFTQTFEQYFRQLIREELADRDDGSGSGDGLGRSEVEAIVAEQLDEFEPGDGGGSGEGDGVSREEVEAMLAEFVSGIDFGGDLPEGLDELVGQINEARRSVMFPERAVGPTEPGGAFHTIELWGNHIGVSERLDRSLGGDEFDGVAHIGHATVHAEESGEFTAALAEYDGEEEFSVVDETVIEVDEGESRVNLDLSIPEGGEYWFGVEGTFSLRRDSYSGLDGEDGHYTNGLKLIGGSKPGDYDKPNGYWYYFFDCEISAHPDFHLER